jgi:AcrR family transcriptional regulator
LPELPEQSSPKAARVLAAARELLLSRGSRGFTVADVAAKAHVGKGTPYLYWATKEHLLLDLVARDFIAAADEYIAALTADPDLVRPSRMCPRLMRTAFEHPLVGPLQKGDDNLLGALTDDPRSAALLDVLGPTAVMRKVLPIMRSNGLARTDWALADQALAMHALTTGFVVVSQSRAARGAADPEEVLSAAVTALLGPEQASRSQVEATAAATVELLSEGRSTVLETVAQRGATGQVADAAALTSGPSPSGR